jgi:hypothetical protein
MGRTSRISPGYPSLPKFLEPRGLPGLRPCNRAADGRVGEVRSEVDTNLCFSLYIRADGESVSDTP